MAVEPSSLENVPLKNLKALLEATATWQSWAAASGRVHYVGWKVDPEALRTRPYAVVSFEPEDGFAVETSAVGVSAASGSVVLTIEADRDSAQNVADAFMTFTNKTGVIIAEMDVIAHGSAPPFVFRRGVRMHGPYLIDEDDYPDEPEYFVSEFRFDYDLSPTS